MCRLVIAEELVVGIAAGVPIGLLKYLSMLHAKGLPVNHKTSREQISAALTKNASQFVACAESLHIIRLLHATSSADLLACCNHVHDSQAAKIVITKPLSSSQARSAEVVSLSREAAELMERLEAAEAAADRYEAKYRAAKGELQQSQALNAQHTAELEQLSESLSNEQAAAQSSQQAVEELTTRLNTIQVSCKVLYSL